MQWNPAVRSVRYQGKSEVIFCCASGNVSNIRCTLRTDAQDITLRHKLNSFQRWLLFKKTFKGDHDLSGAGEDIFFVGEYELPIRGYGRIAFFCELGSD